MDVTREFVSRAVQLIETIYQSSNESLRFEQLSSLKLKEEEILQLVNFLLQHDFIEVEENSQAYFLTPESYQLLERGRHVLEAKIWATDQQNATIDFKEEQTHDEPESDIREKEFDRQNRKNMIRFVVLLCLLVSFVGYISYRNGTQKTETQIEPNLLDHLQEDIQNEVDSIKSFEKKD